MNNEENRYVYGYNLGWNVTNEYMDGLENIFDGYNEQLEALKRLESDHQINSAAPNRRNQFTEEQLRQTYNEFYADSNISFEQFKKNTEEENLKNDNEFIRETERFKDEYEANIYYLIDIKEETIKKLNITKRNLNDNLKKLLLQFKANPLSKDSDEIFLDIQKIRHTVSEIDNKISELKITKEEGSLRLKGLNPRSKGIYEDLKNRRNLLNPIPDPIPDPVPDPIPDPVPDPIPDPILNIEDYTTDYEKKLANYHMDLSKYDKACENILMMYDKLLNKEILQSEFDSYEQEIENMYKDIERKYDNFVLYREETLRQVMNGKLWHPSLTDDDIEELKSIGIFKPEGYDYIDYLYSKGLDPEYINEPREPQHFREFLKELKPNSNRIRPEISKIIDKVRGDIDVNAHESLIIKLNNVKVINTNKFKERTIIDIPMRLIRKGIGTIARGLGHLYGKAVYKASSSLQEKYEEMKSRVNKLTNEEIEYFSKAFKDGSTMASYKKQLPNPIWDLLLMRIMERNYSKVEEENLKIKLEHEKFLAIYREMKSIKNKLNNDNLGLEETLKLQNNYQEYNSYILDFITNVELRKAEISSLLNPTGGTKGYEDNWKAAINQITGGKKNQMKDDPIFRHFSADVWDKISEAMDNNDGLTAAEYFIYREKVRIDHDIIGKSVRNFGGDVQKGEYEYKPLAEIVDYSEHHAMRDFLRTVAIAVSAYNIINQIQLKNAIGELQQECANRGVIIQQLQQQNSYLVSQIRAIQNKYSIDPVEFESSYYNLCQQTVGYGSQTVEVIAQKGAAGAANTSNPIIDSSNSNYNAIDDIGHAQHTYVEQLERIHADSSLTETQKVAEFDKVMTNYYSEMEHVVNISQQNLLKFISSSSYNHVTLQEVINQAGNTDPKLASDLFRELTNIIKDINDIDLSNKIIAALNNVDIHNSLWPAIATLSSVIGTETINSYYDSQRNKIDKNDRKSEFNNQVKEDIEDLKESYMDVDVDMYQKAREEYERRKQVWDSYGPLYRLIHRKEKPREIDVQFELLEGRSR